MTRLQRKAIEREFYNYPMNQEKIANAAEDCAYKYMSIDYASPRVKSSPAGNSTENRIVKLIGDEDRAWRWCEVFEKTMEHFYFSQKDELIRRRYLAREHYLVTCNALCLSISTYFYWLDNILQVAYQWAKKLDII